MRRAVKRAKDKLGPSTVPMLLRVPFLVTSGDSGVCCGTGYQALAQLRGRVPELLERHGLGEEVLIEKYLKPLLEAKETKFFNEGKLRVSD